MDLTTSDHQPLVSVIIPTRDAGKVLGRCLDSIQSQSYLNFEIVVADNYSHDEIVNIAKKYGAKIITAGPRAR